MIEIKIKKLKDDQKGLSALGEKTKAKLYNLTAEKMAGKFAEKLKDVTCADHPHLQRQTITFVVDKDKVYTVDKSMLCCKKLSDRLQLEPTNK